jgi:hypothetical protein
MPHEIIAEIERLVNMVQEEKQIEVIDNDTIHAADPRDSFK